MVKCFFLIDFNGMSTHLEFKEYLHLCSCFLRPFFCTQSYQIQIIFNQIYLTKRWDPKKYYYFWSVMAMKKYSIPANLQNWSLTIRCRLVSYSGHIFLFGQERFTTEDRKHVGIDKQHDSFI